MNQPAAAIGHIKLESITKAFRRAVWLPLLFGKKTRSLGMFSTLLLSMTIVSTANAQQLSDVTVRFTQAGTSLSYAAGLYARSAGYFEEEGLKMDYLAYPPNSGSIVNLLAANKADIGIASPGPLYAALSQGRKIKSYATTDPSPALGLTLSNETIKKLQESGVTASSPIADKINSLRGLTLASIGTGTATYALLGAILKVQDLKLGTDVRLLRVSDHPLGAASTRQGQAEGYFAPPPALLTGPTEGWGTLFISVDEVADLAQIPWIDLMARTDFAEKNPQVMKAFMRAMWKVVADFRNRPEHVAETLYKEWYQDMDRKLFDAGFQLVRKAIATTLLPSEAGVNAAIRLYNETAEVPVAFKLDDVYDLRYAQMTK